MSNRSGCLHRDLVAEPSSHAAEAGYIWPDEKKRCRAATLLAAGKSRPAEVVTQLSTFPGPLVLPGDDLAYDPEWPEQSLNDWTKTDRNPITPEKRTIYVAKPPSSDRKLLSHLNSWKKPNFRGQPTQTVPAPPPTGTIVEYLRAFYQGMDVVELSTPLKFVPWEEENSLSKNHTEPPAFIGLAIGEECVRIRTRACPDGAFDRQLNLDDLLDACMSLLPENAFTLLLMVNHDIYENDDDDYCCGRAYGASRVAVVSNARYNPVLDTDLDASREHAWPASHCASYIQSLVKPAKKKKRAKLDPENIADRATSPSPLEAAVAAYKALPSLLDSPSMQLLDGLYLSRVCRTASHEVGHCFGFDHCVYYACMMQGTASGEEDARQPPYLCPVDMAKWRKAIARSRPGLKEAQIYQGLLEFCEQRPNVHLFAAFAAWIRRHLELSAKNLN